MRQDQYFKNKLFSIRSEAEFAALCLEVFAWQAAHNPVYRNYLELLKFPVSEVEEPARIPFLPISFFKTHEVITGNVSAERVFTSSGTSGAAASRHHVSDLDLYEESFTRGFRHFYGRVEEYCVLALLPSYLEREGSSLVYMADWMIRLSADTDSGFYLNEYDQLYDVLREKIRTGKRVLLLGVTFGLLDFAEKYTLPESDIIVMETGGMKGRRKEMLRTEVHEILKPALGVKQIHSEYGMTELLSQAYSQRNGRFFCPPWMKAFARQVDDPFVFVPPGKTGGLNIIDLANTGSCAFIETQDLGRLHSDNSFEVMGRFDNSDIRGCNLMVL